MSNLALYTFGVTKADISANGDTATPASWVNIPLIADGSITYQINVAEVADGDGKLRLNWFHSQRAKVQLMTKQTIFRLIELATGSAVSSYQGQDKIQFGVDSELNPPFTRLRVQCKAVDASANRGYMEAVLYRTRGKMGNVSMKETTVGTYTIEFEAELASFDDLGNATPNGAYGHLTGLKSSTN